MSRITDLESYLGRRLEGEVSAREEVREKYATDASLYRVLPAVVAFPRHAGDVARAVSVASDRGLAVTARCAGTNLSGSAVGPGLVLDFSRHMGCIRGLAREGGEWFVTAEPGVIKGRLDAFLAARGLRLPPDPSSAEICMLGGNVATRASGAHAVRHGSMDDYLAGVELVDAAGRHVGAMGDEAEGLPVEALAGLRGIAAALEGDRESLSLLERKRGIKSASGYNLEALLRYRRSGPLVTHLMSGSVGTLGLLTLLKLRVVPLAERRLTLAVWFRDLGAAAGAVPRIRELGATAIELVDDASVEIVRRRYPSMSIPQGPANLLIVEFEGPGAEASAADCRALLGRETGDPAGFATAEGSPAEEERLWEVRRALVPILSTWGGGLKPEAFVEDIAVDVALLPELIVELKGIFRRRGLVAGFYGHVGDGNLHVRPLIDLNDPARRASLGDLAGEVYGAVLRRGGTITAEHGMGRVRAPFLALEWGERIHGYMRRIKETLDPRGILNPEVMFTTRGITDDLKYPLAAAGPHDESCVDCGYCNAVCPVSRALGGEEGARSWIHAARLRRRPDTKPETAARIARDLGGCLGCGRCEVRCPSGSSVRRMLRDERAAAPRQFSGLVPALRALTWAREGILALGRMAATLSPLWQGEAFSRAAEGLWGLETAHLGPFRERDIREVIREAPPTEGGEGVAVGFFVGCGHALLADGVVESVLALLGRLGVRAIVPEQGCCGRPMDHYGLREESLVLLRRNVSAFSGLAPGRIIAPCASCAHMLGEYGRLLPEDDPMKGAAVSFSARVRDLAGFLLEDTGLGRLAPRGKLERKVAYHVPCHQSLAGTGDAARELLRAVVTDPVILPEGCCGGAGAYPFLEPDLSRKIFEGRLGLLADSGAAEVVTSCPGCRQQYAAGLKGRGWAQGSTHLANLIAGLR